MSRRSFRNASRTPYRSGTHDSRRAWRNRLEVEALEERVVLDGQIGVTPLADLADVDKREDSPDETTPNPFDLVVAAEQGDFIISDFRYDVPGNIDTTKQFVQGNLMFVSDTARSEGHVGGVTFGTADAPAWVLIGLRPAGGRFTPMLLTYGVTSLFGTANKGNSITWTDGLYTVSNDSTESGRVLGGFLLRRGAGKMFGDALVNTGVPVAITKIENGTVTTAQPHGLAPGSSFQFTGLTGGNSATLDQTKTYYVVRQTTDVDKKIYSFTFTDEYSFEGDSDPSHNVPNQTLNADGGNIVIPDGLNDPGESVWGVDIGGSEIINMLGSGSLSDKMAAGFMPLRMLLTTDSGSVTRLPLLQFEGTQSIGLKGSHVKFGIGGQTANNAKNLIIDVSGRMSLRDAQSNENVVTFTASIGDPERRELALTQNGVRIQQNGVSEVITSIPHRLKSGQVFSFSNLQRANDEIHELPSLYYVDQVLSDTEFTFKATPNGPAIQGASAQSGNIVIDPKEVPVGSRPLATNGVSVGGTTNRVEVRTGSAHGFASGDRIVFEHLVNAQNIRPYPFIYVVDTVLDETTFTIKDLGGNATAQGSAAGGIVSPAGSFLQEVKLFYSQPFIPVSGTNETYAVARDQDPGVKSGQAFYFLDLNGAQGVAPFPTVYYVKDINTIDDRLFTFSASPNGPAVQGASAMRGGRIVWVTRDRPVFRVAGLNLWGEVQVVMRLEGDIARVQNSEFGIGEMELQIYGRVEGSFAAGGVSGSFGVTLGSNNGSSSGITIKANSRGLTVPDWGFSLDGTAKIGTTVTLSLANITVTHTTDVQTKLGRTVINGAVKAAIPNWNTAFEASMGRGLTDGLVFVEGEDGVYRLESFNARIDISRTKPSDGTSFGGTGLHIWGGSLQVTGKLDDHGGLDSLDVSGMATLAIGDSKNQQNPNQWDDNMTRLSVIVTPGFVHINQNGIQLVGTGSLKITASGEFKIGNGAVTLGAQNLSITYTRKSSPTDPNTLQDYLLLSGTVTATLFDKYQWTIELGDGGGAGGLNINLDTGKWELEGFRFVFPKKQIGPLLFDSLTVGFNEKAPNDYEMLISGTIEILGVGGIAAKLDFEEKDSKFVLHSVGIAMRGLNPGIPIATSGAFLTDIGAEVDDIDKGNVAIEGLIGGTFGRTITIGGQEYALARVSVDGKFTTNPFTADVKGTLQLGGGILGEATAEVQYDSAPYLLVVDVSGKLVYEVFNGHFRAVDNSTAFGALATLDLDVPSFIPIIGGLHVGEVGVVLVVPHVSTLDRFIAGWFDFLGVEAWKIGLKYDFNDETWSVVHGSEVDGLIGQVPSGVNQNPPHRYSVQYSHQPDVTAAAEPPTYSSALFHVPITGNDPTTEVWITVDNDSQLIWKPGQQPGHSVDVGGVRFRLVDGLTHENGVTFHAVKVPAEGETEDDPYLPLPQHTYTVSLVSGTEQPDPAKTSAAEIGWVGSFSSPPPQARKIQPTQPNDFLLEQAASEADPNIITLDFEYRALNPETTSLHFYSDFDKAGYDGHHLLSVQATDLTSSEPDSDHWRTSQVQVDIRNLPAFPTYFYAVVQDDTHAPHLVAYSDMAIVPHPEIYVGVSVQNGGTPRDLEDWRVELMPVTKVAVTNISAGENGQPSVVHTTTAHGLRAGDKFVFNDLVNASDLNNGQTYFVKQVLDSRSFTLAAASQLDPLTDASADRGTIFYDTPDATPVVRLTDTSGHTSLNPDVNQTGHEYRITITRKQQGFNALPEANIGQTASVDGDMTQYVHVDGVDSEVNADFTYRKVGMIEGRVFSDLDADGQRQLKDPGVPNVVVYLDENNNNQYDPGEPTTKTDEDGVYRFLHDFEAPTPQPPEPQPMVAGSIQALLHAQVQGIAAGVVTTTSAHSFSRGSVFQFQGLQNASGVADGQTYYVVDTPSETTFRFAAQLNGTAIDNASSGAGMAVGALTTLTSHELQLGKSFTFSDLENASGIENGQTYYVASLPTPHTLFFSATPGGPIVTDAAATRGAIVTDAFTVFKTPIVSLTDGKVTTGEPHQLSKGQAITFEDLENPVNVAEEQIYYVVNVPSDTTFTFSAQPNGEPIAGASASVADASVVTSADNPLPEVPTVDSRDPYTVSVRQILPEDWKLGTSPANPVTISSSHPQSTDNNFLNVQQVVLSGTAFQDANGNGRQDAGEPGLSGVSVQVHVPGQMSPTTLTTDSLGFWQGMFAARGNYQIQVIPPNGATLTMPAGHDTYSLTADLGGNFGGYNFGMSGVSPPAGSTVSGVVFSDINNNGIHDPGEPTLPGYMVELINELGRQTALTDLPNNAGGFQFDGADRLSYLDVLHAGKLIEPTQLSNVVAYDVPPAMPGNSGSNEAIGMPFNAVAPVRVTSLGIFDSKSDGFQGKLTVKLYDRTSQQALATLTFTKDAPGILNGGNRFKNLDVPLLLPAGFQGLIVAEGWSEADPKADGLVAPFQGAPLPWTTHDGDGSIGFVGSALHGPAGSYPTTSTSGPPNVYAAGTFQYHRAEPPVLVPVASSETGIVPPLAGSADVRAGHLQGNGQTNDIAVLVGDNIGIRLTQQDGTYRFISLPTGLQPPKAGYSYLELVDINGDGLLDLAAAAHGGVSILLSTGFGRFKDAQTLLTQEFAGRDVALTVIPGQPGELPTILAAPLSTGSEGVTIYELRYDAQTGTMTQPQRVAEVPSLFDMTSGDVNGDGKHDLVFTNKSTGGRVSALLGPSFTAIAQGPAVTEQASRLILADMFGDGTDEIVYIDQKDTKLGELVVLNDMQPSLITESVRSLHFATTLTTARAGETLGDQATITVHVLDPDGTLRTDDNSTQVTLFLDKNPGGARFIDSNGAPLTGNPTVQVSGGVATFKDIRLDKTGIGYTLGAWASDHGLQGGHSNPFIVAAADPYGLEFREPILYAFTSQPINNKFAGRASNTFLGVSVQLVDRFGNPTPGKPAETGEVTIELGANPAGAALAGSNKQTLKNGVALFEDLLIPSAGQGFTFKVSGTVGGLTLKEAESEPFNVSSVDPNLIKLANLSFVAPQPLDAKYKLGERLPPLKVDVVDTRGQIVADNNTLRVTLTGAGLISGTTTVVVKNGVATFDDIFLSGTDLSVKSTLDLTAQLEDIGREPATLTVDRSPGEAAVLKFVETEVATTTAGDRITTHTGKPIQVQVKDAYNNPIPNAPVDVYLGVLRTGDNPDVTLLANHAELGDPSHLDVYVIQKPDEHGVATFDNLYINRASDKYLLAVGTTTGFLSPDTTKAFDVKIGAPDQVRILGTVHDVGSRRRLTSDAGAGVLVSISDRVGNTIVTDNSTQVSISLDPASPSQGALKGEATLTVRNGLALFDRLYIDQAATQSVAGYQLRATVSNLSHPEFTSNTFTVNPPPNVPADPPEFVVQQQPSASVTPDQAFSFSFRVGPEGSTTYDADAQVFVQLVDEQGIPVPPRQAVLEGGPNAAKPKNGIVTFDYLKIKTPGVYRIRAIQELFAMEVVTSPFTVGAVTSNVFSTLQSSGAVDAQADEMQGAVREVGLGSITENFDYVSSFDVYSKLPDGTDKPIDQLFLPPSDAPNFGSNQKAPMRQPQVHPEFNQVAQTHDWWTSLIFPRATAQGNDERDSQGRQLFPMFPHPMATMVNSSTTFAGLGLGTLTHRFVQPSVKYLDPEPDKPAQLPDARYPANTAYFFDYDNGVINDPRGYQDFAIGLRDVQADARVLRYSDWTVTIDWNDRLEATLGKGLPFAYFRAKDVDAANGAVMQLVPNQKLVKEGDTTVNKATVKVFDSQGQEVNDATPRTGPVRVQITYTLPDQVVGTDPDNDKRIKPIDLEVTVDNSYGLFLPHDVEWTFHDGKLEAKLTPDHDYFSVASLPDHTKETFDFFRQRAYTHVTGSTSQFTFNEDTGEILTTFTLQTQQMESGGDLVDRPLQALYLHQWRNLAPNTTLTKYEYVSPRGTMKVFDGAEFSTQLYHRGTLPLVPPVMGDAAGDHTFHATFWREQLLPFLHSVSSISQVDGSLSLDLLLPPLPTNNYLEAQAMLGAIQLVPILIEVAESADPNLTQAEREFARTMAERVFQKVKDHMGAWLSAQDDENIRLFYYQPRELNEAEAPTGIGWQSLVGLPDGFLSSESLNDHHLIGGYFLKTAAIIAQYDRYWGDNTQLFDGGHKTLTGKMGDIVNLIVRDISNYDRDDAEFPFLRTFDVYEGHSWADGAANDRHGTNQESSSEALNYASALIQWGEAVGDDHLRDLGVYLYNTEVESFNTYYFNVNDTDAFPDEFKHFVDEHGQQQERPSIAILHNAQAAWGGFIGTIPSRMLGIQILPLTGGSYYLGRDPDFVAKNFEPARAKEHQRQIGETPPAPSSYLSLIYPYYAFANADEALKLYTDELDVNSIVPINPNVYIDSTPFNLHWIRVLQEYGHVDASVSADTVSYLVFAKDLQDPSTRTFIAYNRDPVDRQVTFRDKDGSEVHKMMVPARSMKVSDVTGNKALTQTDQDFSLKTPQNRFFFSSQSNENGNYTLLHGLPGTGEKSIEIPAPGNNTFPNMPPDDSVTFVLTGVSGTLQSSLAAGASYSLWLDPTYTPNSEKVPFVQVQVVYDDGKGGKVTVNSYGGTGLSNNPGYVEARSSDGAILAPVANPPLNLHLPAELVNGTITVHIWVREGGDTPVRFRTDAAAEQGRVSFIDFPYDFTAVNGQSVESLNLPLQFVTSTADVSRTPFTIDSPSQVSIVPADLRNDSQQGQDILVGIGGEVILFENPGKLGDGIPFIERERYSAATPDSKLAGLVPVELTPDRQTDLVALDANGKLATWYNVTGAQPVTVNAQTPSGSHNLGVNIPGSSAILIQGTIFHDLNRAGHWDESDPGVHEGVQVYVDLNNNGKLDPGEPSRTPSIEGVYSFAQLQPGTYQLRLHLGVDGVTNAMTQTFPADNGPVEVTVEALGGVFYGADFGVYINPAFQDFNNDGHADRLIRDPDTHDVHVQLLHGETPVSTHYIATLPGPDWQIAGIGDWTEDGRHDLLVHDTQTGDLQLWQLTGGPRPRLNEVHDLTHDIPDGWDLVEATDRDRNGTPDLLLQHQETGMVSVWHMLGRNVIEQRTIVGGTGDDILEGGTGDDTLAGNQGDDVLTGGPGNDDLSGGAGDDVLDGGADDDTLAGDQGDDTLIGGPGNDNLSGGAGDDVLDGGTGTDTLAGDQGDDTLTGGPGNDNLFGGSGDDNLDGGTGNDILTGDPGDDALTGGAGDDELFGGSGDDQIHGGAGVDMIYGGAGDDILWGNGGNDHLFGGQGDDRLVGHDGDDLLSGAQGDDYLLGVDPEAANPGRGERDRLMGGAGSDVFALGDERQAYYVDGDGVDTGYAEVADFSQQDVIQLHGRRSDYALAPSPFDDQDTAIYRRRDTSELIGVVKGVRWDDAKLDDTETFRFVGSALPIADAEFALARIVSKVVSLLHRRLDFEHDAWKPSDGRPSQKLPKLSVQPNRSKPRHVRTALAVDWVMASERDRDHSAVVEDDDDSLAVDLAQRRLNS